MHNERCPVCKETVERLLREIYGEVRRNYRIKIGTLPEDYNGQRIHGQLSTIYSALQNYRGFTEFVGVRYIDADFFVPEPGFIVEFDESQHFTEPRKIALSYYPSDLKTGFSREVWMKHCDEICAHDGNPPFRDEQRAWYDTLRDFLPEIKGFLPTMRLYAKEMTWCSLDVKNGDDIMKFKELIEMNSVLNVKDQNSASFHHIPKKDWIATVILKSNLQIIDEKDVRNNPIRISEMEQILRSTIANTSGDGVILFPGGWVHTQHERADAIYPEIEQSAKKILSQTDRSIKVCVGIDGYFDRPEAIDAYDQDQMAITIDKTGIIADCRKFYPTNEEEREHIIPAENCYDGEHGKPRIFELNGVKYFPFVCHDVYGPYKDPEKNTRPDVHVGLNLIHRFRPRGEKLSREDYFPKYGWSEASFQWGIPIFGTAIFFRRSVPSDWPTGVIWKSGNTWRKPDCHEITIPHDPSVIQIPLTEGSAEVRLFSDIPEKIKSVIPSSVSAMQIEKSTTQKASPATNLDPYRREFAAVIERYEELAGSDFHKGGTRSKTNYIVKIKEMPKGVAYYLDDCRKSHQIGIELDVNITRAPQYEPIIRDLEKKHYNNLPQPKIARQETKDGDWLKLQILFPEDEIETIVEGLFSLIDQTYPEIHANNNAG